MLILPAIDLIGGQVVRLRQGDYDQKTVYGDDPCQVAQGFLAAGATQMHVVDLDGAKDGSPRNRDVIARLCQTGLSVEVGGGMRTRQNVEDTLALGVSRIIVGTLAINNQPLLKELVAAYGDKIAVGVDTKDGYVATHGWLETSSVAGVDFCRQLRDMGVGTVIYTDISKDGALSGTNLAVYEQLCQIGGLNIIASGGVTTENEIAALREMGAYGAILGKALYAGRLDLPRALAVARKEAAPC